MTVAARRNRRRQYNQGVFPEYPQPEFQRHEETFVASPAPPLPNRTNGRTLLGFGVALLAVAAGVWLYTDRGPAPVELKDQGSVVFEWDGVEWHGVGREYQKVVDGPTLCPKVEQWLEPVVYPPTGQVVNVLKGVCANGEGSNQLR